MPEISQIVLREMEPGLCLIDDSGRVSLHNKSGRALLEKDLTGCDLLAMKLDDEPPLIVEIVECFRNHKRTGDITKDLLVLTRGDRLRCLSISLFPVDADGVSATGIALTDVSETLTEAPGLTKILSQMRHDLRSPLTSIAGASELLMTQRMGALAENQIRLVKIIEEGARRLGELLENRTRGSEENTKAATGELS